jgi:hypothetical protein
MEQATEDVPQTDLRTKSGLTDGNRSRWGERRLQVDPAVRAMVIVVGYGDSKYLFEVPAPEDQI